MCERRPGTLGATTVTASKPALSGCHGRVRALARDSAGSALPADRAPGLFGYGLDLKLVERQDTGSLDANSTASHVQEGTNPMRHFVGLDVSLHLTNVCIVDSDGVVRFETKVPTDPKAIANCLRDQPMRFQRIGLEAGAQTAWLCQGLIEARLPAICIEARHASLVLRANLNKTDRNDARGIAELMRVSMYRPVHLKTPPAQALRALLTARKLLLSKVIDVELGIGGILRSYGLKVGPARKDAYEAQVRSLVHGQVTLRVIIEPLMKARSTLRKQFDRLEREVKQRAATDPICRRLMTAPGVGPITALTYRCVLDQP